jgi:hypothetical protein
MTWTFRVEAQPEDSRKESRSRAIPCEYDFADQLPTLVT